MTITATYQKTYVIETTVPDKATTDDCWEAIMEKVTSLEKANELEDFRADDQVLAIWNDDKEIW